MFRVLRWPLDGSMILTNGMRSRPTYMWNYSTLNCASKAFAEKHDSFQLLWLFALDDLSYSRLKKRKSTIVTLHDWVEYMA